MSSTSTDRLYQLLPAVYRIRDSTQGQPLQALLSLIQQSYDTVEQDILGLYENWFIETCAEWVVPYIGDLLNVRPLYAASTDTFSARAYVANTLDFRRRKGTAAMLEQLALDVTGWPAHVVEYFALLETTQYMNHLRPANLRTPNLRDSNQLELLGGPFEQIAHTADVRHISDQRGRYNIPNIGIFVWRLEAFLIGPIATATSAPAKQSDARPAATPADGRYTFDPTGVTAPLFNTPQAQAIDGGLVTEVNVPGALRRRPLYDELEALRQSEVDNAPTPAPVWFGANPVFQVMLDGAVLSNDQVMICDTGDISATDWRRPAASKNYIPSAGGVPVSKPIRLSVDPVRGRIALPTGAAIPKTVEVSYTYAFSAEIGAGSYDRGTWLNDSTTGPPPLQNADRWQAAVSQSLAPVANLVFPTFAAAIASWNSQPPGTDGVIAITDSRTYRETLSGSSGITIPAGSRLLIVAADWAALRQPGPPASKNLTPNGFRPHLLGSLTVTGTAAADSPIPGGLFIDGLLLEGSLTIADGNLGALTLSHSTITPAGSLNTLSSGVAGGDNDSLAITIYRSLCGPIMLGSDIPTLNTMDSIVDGLITAPDATLNIQTTTVFGQTGARAITASDSLFTDVVTATRRQTGCVRFSYLPPGSKTASRYRCQPDLALTGLSPANQAPVLARLTPQFTSTDFGQPGYAQLGVNCATEIKTGADNGSEMGAFNFLQQPQRTANLLTALNEYLRFGLEAGVFQQT
jgi:hypothetical protein